MAPRVYVKEFTMKLGPAITTGLLTPIRSSDGEPSFNLCGPKGQKVYQIYKDDEGNYYEFDELSRAVKEKDEDGDEVLRMVDKEEIDKAKTSKLEPNFLELTMHRSVDISRFMFPDKGQGYVFKPCVRNSKGKVIPSAKNDKWHEFLNIILRDGDVALVGKCNLRNHEGFFRLGLYQGNIFLQKQLYPENLHNYDFFEPTLSDELAEKARMFTEKNVREFNPEDYDNQIKARLEMIASGDFSAKEALGTPEEELDILAELEEYV